jgi:PAS domain S-box-containing protein
VANPVANPTLADYLTVGQAAELLGVSAWTLRNWDKSGKLKPHRHPINGHRLYRHEELTAVLAEARGGPGARLTPDIDWSKTGESDHFVQFYESDRYLADSVGGFIGEGLEAGGGGIVIASRPHRTAILKRLKARGLDVAGLRKRGRLVVLDAADTLAELMADGSPDPERFAREVGTVVARMARGRRRVRAFGEMVALLWAAGNRAAAIRLEELWSDLGRTHSFALYCAYPLTGVGHSDLGESFADVCGCHTRVLPTETYTTLATAEERLRAIAGLQQKARSLEAEIAHREQVEGVLAQRERELADFFQNAVEGLHRVGPDGTVLWANKAELDLLGYSAHEYVGRHIAEFHVDREVIEDMLARLARGDALRDHPARMRHKDGSVRHVRVSSNACFEDGRLAFTRCFTRDETDRVRAEEALRATERRFAGFMQHLPGLAWIKDLGGRYIYANAAAERAFRTPRAGLYGKTDDEVFSPETAALFRENDRRALDKVGGVQVVEALRHEDGVHHSLVSKFPIPGPEGEPAYIGGMAIDISDRIRAEEALKEADRRKDEFLATLAHELRNPLAPLCNMLEVLKRAGGDGAMLQTARDTIERQLGQLVRLVDDLLDLNRITHNRLELRQSQVELSSVIQQAVEACRPLADSAGHELRISLPADPIHLHADAARLAQVFGNLLNNSCKYTSPGGKIWVTAERLGSEVVVAVKDSGTGIPPGKLDSIFDMFTQVDRSLEGSRGGLGIGLTLVKRLVRMHGGSIEARSPGEGQGSEFVVRLPILIGTSKAVTPGPSAAQEPQRTRRILVVDDNRDSAESLAMLLTIMGNETHLAHDGVAAIEAVERYRPEVVLLDIGLPKLSGHDVCRRVREQSWGKDIVIIALTGWGQEEDRRKSREAGFDGHLVKPVDPAALLELLSSLVSAAGAS